MKAVILDKGELTVRDVPKPSPGYEEAWSGLPPQVFVIRMYIWLKGIGLGLSHRFQFQWVMKA